MLTSRRIQPVILRASSTLQKVSAHRDKRRLLRILTNDLLPSFDA